MEKYDLLQRIREGEGLFQEFKTSLEKIDRSLVAFANTNGGVVYWGVNDRGESQGIKLSNSVKGKIESIARNIDPPLPLRLVDLGDSIAILVKEGDDKPYKCSDGFFMRVGATNQKLSRDEIFDMALRVNRIRYEALQDLNFHYPRDFSKSLLEAFTQRSGLEQSCVTMGQEKFLISLGVAERQRGRLIFNRAGILFFGKNPQTFMPQAKVSYARYQGTTKSHVVDRVIFTGPLMEQLTGILKRLEFDIPRRYRLADTKTREELPHYPLRALEEAVANALIHRDYSESGAETMIDYYTDRIEICNPGELLGRLSIASLGSKALRRNPLVAELLYRIGKGEKLGSGIARMRRLMQEWRLSLPRFEEGGGFFSITFEGPKGDIAEEKLLTLPLRPRRFVEGRHQIEEPFPAVIYADRFKVTQRTAQKDLELLLERKILIREGRGKNTRYRFRYT